MYIEINKSDILMIFELFENFLLLLFILHSDNIKADNTWMRTLLPASTFFKDILTYW